MESHSTVKSLNKNEDEETSQENVIKLILQNLIKRYSLEKIIDDINSIAKDNENENEIILNEKIPLDSKDIISILYNNVGCIKLYRSLLDICQQSKETSQKNETEKELKSEKFNIWKKSKPHFSTEEEENPQINNYKDINKNNKEDELVIEINNMNEDIDNENNIITLNEDDDDETVFEPKIERKGKKEKREKKEKKEKKLRKPIFVDTDNVSGDSNKKEKVSQKKKLGFHYTFNEGNLYKFRIKKINDDNAIFICDDIYCKAFGEFSIKDNSFKLIREHNIPNDEHIYNEIMSVKDKNVLKYMKDNNIDDIQLIKS